MPNVLVKVKYVARKNMSSKTELNEIKKSVLKSVDIGKIHSYNRAVGRFRYTPYNFFSSCVPNPNCNGKVETDSKMKSDCFNINDPTDEKICCNDNDVIEVPPPCSELPEYR